MSKINEEYNVYSQFLNNLAVAWFAAGIIAPLLTSGELIAKAFNAILAIFACFICLRLSVYYAIYER